MTAIEWDKVGERTYQTGVDRGVLYFEDETVVPWNGLTSVEDDTNSELKSYYLDGIKFLDHVIPGDYSGKIKAFTYPEEFNKALGIVDIGHGVSFHEQPPKKFNLCYRTKVGNDVEADYGYKIHLLYNLVAIPDNSTFESLGNQVTPVDFGWSLTGVPPSVDGYRPPVHITVDSNEIGPYFLNELEKILYGTSTTDPRFPSIDEFLGPLWTYDDIVITDNGDGTWSATDHDGDYISMTDPTTFQIDEVNAAYLDADTYDVSSTNVG